MTRELAKKYLPFIQAAADGKIVQWCDAGRSKDHWSDCDDVVTITAVPPEELRLKPSPTFRPWTSEEVPIDAWFRTKINPHRWHAMHFFNCRTGEIIIGIYQESRLGHRLQGTPKFAFENWEHSTDGGKTWLPCGVQISGEVAP